MMKLFTWWYYWGRYLLRTKTPAIWKKLGFKYVKIPFLDLEGSNQYLTEKLSDVSPFMACRIGANEAFTMRTFEFEHRKNKEKALKQLCNCAGFFPEEEAAIYQFKNLMEKAYGEADLCGVLQCPFDDYFINQYARRECKATILNYLEPFDLPYPWSMQLQNKKVLVIHPFEKTIRKQYEKRENIFENQYVLPSFELLTLKAVQTAAGEKDSRFSTWFQALDYMVSKIKTIDFDVALIGCGAYGLPIAAEIKKMGKQAVHVGGGLQILFGIKGKRWDINPAINKFYNEYWVYPDESETPKGSDIVENSCYWR